MVSLEVLVGISLTVGVVILLIFLEVLHRKSRRTDPVSRLESQLRKKGFSVERKELGTCSILIAKRPFKKALMAVGKRIDIETLKEVFYVSYNEGVSEVNVICSEITKEALEAIRMAEKNRRIHRTKVRYERDVVGVVGFYI